jgi:hypothetical protein
VCIALWFAAANSGIGAPPKVPMKDFEVASQRADIAAVIGFAAAEMAGQRTANPMVGFVPQAREALSGEKEIYAGFGTPRFLMTRFAQSTSNPEWVELGVVLSYVDGLLRRCSVSVLLECEWKSGKITVHQARMRPVVSPEPETLVYIVPAQRVPRDLLAGKTHAELLVWLTQNALKNEEIKGEPMPCFVFALTMDRMKGCGRIALAIDGAAEGIPEPAKGSRSLDYNGWPVALLHGTFRWRSDPEFFVKVVEVPDAEGGKPQLMGVVGSKLAAAHSAGDAKGTAKRKTGVSADPAPAGNPADLLEKARRDCRAAYDKMMSFLAEGNGDTKEGMKAYDDYVKAKAACDKIRSEQKTR